MQLLENYTEFAQMVDFIYYYFFFTTKTKLHESLSGKKNNFCNIDRAAIQVSEWFWCWLTFVALQWTSRNLSQRSHYLMAFYKVDVT